MSFFLWSVIWWRWLKFMRNYVSQFRVWSWVVLVRIVICTNNTNRVHTTWLTCTIHVVCVSNVSMRHIFCWPYLMYPIISVCVRFSLPMIRIDEGLQVHQCHMWSRDGASESCDMLPILVVHAKEDGQVQGLIHNLVECEISVLQYVDDWWRWDSKCRVFCQQSIWKSKV
jgi:hypothetical protein